jgi:pyruvate ferredoxin oxidoreductase gamma subunit
MAAYNRVDDRPIRRHDSVRRPDYVVVLDDTLLGPDTVRGLCPDGLLLVNTSQTPEEIRRVTGYAGRIWCVPASAMARAAGVQHANVVLVGALAAALGDVTLESLEGAVRDLLGPRLGPTSVEATVAAMRAGFGWGAGRRAA